MQTKLKELIQELCSLTDYRFRPEANDELVYVFQSQIFYFADEFRKDFDRWGNLDAATIDALKSAELNYLLPLELVDDLTALLLDEFGQSITEHVFDWAKQIRGICAKIRSLINLSLACPEESRLPSKLDSPVLRHQLSIDFDQALCSPVAKMIDLIEDLLKSENLNSEQRKYLSQSLRSSHQLHRVLQTARPLIESQNFQAMALLSHHYRSPFCGITGFFLMLLEDEFNTGLQESQLHSLASLRDYAYTILPMINNLLDASKFIAGIELSYFSPTPITKSIEYFLKTIDIFKKKFPKTDIVLKIPAQVLDSTMAVPEPQSHCLRLILENAFKYAPEGSITIEAQMNEDWLCISMDTGIAIPESEFDTIFEPFTQVGEQKKGLGLGLYLAHQYAEKSGGSIAVESQLGQGSKFTVKLPILKASQI